MSEIQIKGPSLNYIAEFIKEKFNGRYNEWFDKLPPKSKDIFKDMILSTNWYSLQAGHIDGIKTLGLVFFEGDVFKAAYEMGKFGGKKALTGIYKIFIKIPSIDFIVKKVSTISSTYYSEEINIEVITHSESKIALEVRGFLLGQELMMPNIGGWIDNLMSIISKKSYKIEYKSTPTDNNHIIGNIDILFF